MGLAEKALTLAGAHCQLLTLHTLFQTTMVPRSLLARRLRLATTCYPRHARFLTTPQKINPDSATANDVPESSSPQESARVHPPPPPPQTWLTRKIKEDPAARRVFFTLLKVLGYGSAKQYAGRRAFAMYTKLCIPRPDEDSAFWKDGEHMPPLHPIEAERRGPPMCATLCIDSSPINTADGRSYSDKLTMPCRVPPPTNLPVMVHNHEPTRLAPHSPATLPPCASRTELCPRAHRPLLHRHRGPCTRRAPTRISQSPHPLA